MFLPKNEIKVVDRIDHFIAPLTTQQISAVLDADENSLLLESVHIADIEQTYYPNAEPVPAMMLEAIKAKAARLETRIIGFSNTLNKYLSPTGIEVTGREISKPKKSGSVAIQVAKINLSDGQSISLVFHAPDEDPLRIKPDDTLIAFRFMVNSRDVTHAVAPAGGRDVSRSQMALALSNLVEKNSAKFSAAQEKNQAQNTALEEAKAQMETLESEIAENSEQLNTLEADNEKKLKRISTLNSQIDNQNDIQNDLRKQLESRFVPGTGENAELENDGLNKESGLLHSARFKAAADAVVKDGNKRMLQSLMNISGIDNGLPDMAGYDRSLFVSNLASKLKTLKRQNKQLEVNNILTMIAEYNSASTKPAFTKRHSIWNLGEVNDVPETNGSVTSEEDGASGLHWYGLRARPYGMGNTPSDVEEVKVIDAEQAQIKFPYAGDNVRHGAIAYAEPLTDKQVSDFELRPLVEGQSEYRTLANVEVAETAVRYFLDDWMDENGTDKILSGQLDEIVMQIAASNFKQAFGKLLRNQPEFEERTKDEKAYKVWDASLSLVTPAMVKDEADAMNVLVSPTRERNEKAIAALTELTKRKSLWSGWSLDKSSLDLAVSNLDKEMLVTVSVESPLVRVGDVSPYGEYDIHFRDNGHFSLTSSEGSPIEGAEILTDWQQIKDALHTAYVAELDDKDLIARILATDAEEDFNSLRNAEGLPPVTGLDESGEETLQHSDNSSNFMSQLSALITSVNQGVLALKEAKVMLTGTISPNVPDSIRNSLLSASDSSKSKTRWVSNVEEWLNSYEGYDVNAPVVNVNGTVYDFNIQPYDIITPGLFGKSWSYVGQNDPQELLRAFDIMDDESSELLIDAATKAYLKQVEESEPEPEQEPESEPATEPEQTVTDSEEQQHVEGLRGIRDYTGEATLELVERFQTEIEQAFNYFENTDSLAENNDLLESTFAKLVEMQAEVTV